MGNTNALWKSIVQPCFARLTAEGYNPLFVPNPGGKGFQIYGHGAMFLIDKYLTIEELQEWTEKLTDPDRIRHAAERRLDAIWTLTYRLHKDGAAEIISYSDRNKMGYTVFNELDLMAFREELGDRTVVELFIQPHQSGQSWADPTRSTRYSVRNPQHIFSYSH